MTTLVYRVWRAIFDPNVAAFRPPQILESLAERGDAGLFFRIALGKGRQHADPPHSIGLLRPGRKRPRRRRASKPRYEGPRLARDNLTCSTEVTCSHARCCRCLRYRLSSSRQQLRR